MAEFKTGSVFANGLTFHYLEAGSGSLVLCLHGFPDHARSFRHQLSTLARAGFRVVAPYMRGYAPTQIPVDGSFQSALLARDALALIEALSPHEPAVLLGHDWGAVAAYGAAIQSPQRLEKLITIAVPYGSQVMQAVMTDYAQMRRSWHMFLFQMPIAEMMVKHNDFEFIKRLWRDWSPEWDVPKEEIAAVKETFRKPGVLESALAYYRQTLNPDLQQPALAELQEKMLTMNQPIEVPSLILHGEQDGCIDVGQLQGMQALFPLGLRQAIVPGAGHFVHQEKPEEVNKVLLEFL
jgi:pimeloyl-ACP methyl ester carboxylesterase